MARARCVIVIDNENISRAFGEIKRAQGIPYERRLDYNRMVSSVVARGCEIVEKSIYLGTADSNADGWHRFKTFFERNGFRVIWKLVKEIRDANGDTIRKANMDVEIATDVCRYAWRRDCTEVILFSGDSDFAYLVDQVRELGISVTIVSSIASLSSELRERANRLILLDDFEIEDLLLPVTQTVA